MLMTVTEAHIEASAAVNASAHGNKYDVYNGRFYLFMKRAFDIVSSACALIVCAIPMLVLGIAIRLESPGPAIYKQERLGKDRKPYIMYKFRSMYQDAEKDGPKWAERDDDRCTHIGKWIRGNHLDELPQLINVLSGEMSLVGPRPERDYFYRKFETDIPDFWERLRVKPGLTGLAQIKGDYNMPPTEKLAFDAIYMKNRSLAMDISLILKTFLMIIGYKGAQKNIEK